MITTLLGIRDARLADIHRYGHALGRVLDGVASLGHHREIAEAEVAIGRLVDDLVGLRHSSPVQVVARTPTRDLDIAGHLLPEGTPIVVAVAAANRDPDIFPRPAEFDLDRPHPRDPLAFGAGVHHCVGRPLAETEARLALVALARRFPHRRRAAPEVLGSDRLPVRA